MLWSFAPSFLRAVVLTAMLSISIAPALLAAVWLDTDNSAAAALPGDGAPREIDDALAMLMLLQSPLNVVGISTTFGNAPTTLTTKATRHLLASFFASHALEVHVGAHAPLAELGGNASGLPAVDGMAAALRASHEPLDILALGALTNVAALVRREPELVQRALGRVIFVGGRRPQQLFTVGDHPSTLPDLNFEKDSEAVEVVLRSGAVRALR